MSAAEPEDRNYLQVSEGGGAVAVGAPEGGGEVAPADGQPQPEEPNGSQKFFDVIKSLVSRVVIFWCIMQFFKKSPPAAQPGEDGKSVMRAPATNLFQEGTDFDMFVYISEQDDFNEFDMDEHLYWKLEGIQFGKWDQGINGDSIYEKSMQVPLSERVQNNGSIYIHSFVVKAGKTPNPKDGKRFSKKNTVYKKQRLNKFKKKMYKTTANLLTGETEQSVEDQMKAMTIKSEIVSHWHPNLTINIVYDYTPWVPGQIPPPLDEFVEFTPSLAQYKPILWLNDYWNLGRDYQTINSSTPVMNLTLTFHPISMFKWQMYSAQTMKNKFNLLAGMMGEEEEDNDQDSVKEAFLETNLYLLILTFCISIVHSVFEFLAFKNDIQFWNNRKTTEGLSVRSVFFNVFQNVIIVLYVLDQDTNTMVRISCCVGLVIELWKITKITDVSLDFENPVLGIIPRLKVKEKEEYGQSGTGNFDRMAFKYLGMMCFPLAFCYCIYSVMYNEHKGWYSFILNSCYGFLLTFGFIMMTPQLFINYKMKSVAHLPWRMMTYKALNTFIDDIFAFVIKMPTMYRLGCFRDDIVFFIFLYQRYIYKEDPNRVNEYGVSAAMLAGKTPEEQKELMDKSEADAAADEGEKKEGGEEKTEKPEGEVAGDVPTEQKVGGKQKSKKNKKDD
jgi:hypothetical protein